MANLKGLRQRISSVQSTIKITSAMKMVAASKLKKLQDQKEIWEGYEQEFKLMVSEAFRQFDTLDGGSEWFASHDDSGKVAVVVLSASKGLCGPFNTGLIKETKLMIHNLFNQGLKAELFFIGRRAKEALTSHFSEHFAAFPMMDKKTDEEISKEITAHLAENFLNGYYCKVKIIFNEYSSVVSQKPKIIDLLPLNFETQNIQSQVYEIEPNASVFLNKICPRFLEVLILKTLIETHVGEQASRMVAMDAATRSGKEMVDRLKLELNRTRQAVITKELIEVISGAEAAL